MSIDVIFVGLQKDHLLGYDTSERCFVAKTSQSQAFTPEVTFDQDKVISRLKSLMKRDLIDLIPSQMTQFIQILKTQENPRCLKILALVEKKLKLQESLVRESLNIIEVPATSKLMLSDFHSKPVNTVFVQLAEDKQHYLIYSLFKREPQVADAGQIVCIPTKNLTDRLDHLKQMALLKEVYKSFQDEFLTSNERGRITKDFFLKSPNKMRLALEILKDGGTIRASYLDFCEGKVKEKDISLGRQNESSFLEKYVSLVSAVLEKPYDGVKEVQEKYPDLLVEFDASYDVIAKKLEESNRFIIRLMDPPTTHRMSYQEIIYLDPLSSKLASILTEGNGVSAIEEGIKIIARKRAFAPTFKAFLKTQSTPFSLSEVPDKIYKFKEELKICHAKDFSHYIVFFCHPYSPDIVYSVSSKGSDDLLETVETARKQKKELLELKPSEFLLKNSSTIAPLNIPEPPQNVNPLDIIKLFDKIDWLNPHSPWYRDPTKLRNDGLPSTIEKFLIGITKISTQGSKKENAELYKVMAHITKLLKEEIDPQLMTRCLLDLAEGGLHCEGRNLTVALEVYKALTQKTNTFLTKEIPYGADLIHHWLDNFKDKVILEMVADGFNPHNTHEWIYYVKTLMKKEVHFPLSVVQKYNDHYLRNGLAGKYKKEEDVYNAFMNKFNSKRILDAILELTQIRMQNFPKDTGSALLEILRAYAEASLLDQFLTIKKELEQTVEEFKVKKETILHNNQLDATQQRTLIDQAGAVFASQKTQLLDKIIEQNQFISANSALTEFSLTRAGAQALAIYLNFIK